MCQFSSIHPWYIIGVLCGQYGVVPLLGCSCNVRPTSPMHTLMNWEGCQHFYIWLELMVHHTPSNVETESVPVFFHPCWSIFGVLCGQYGCDPIALLLVELCISPLVNWEWCQYLVYGWLELMVHHTPSKASGQRFHRIWKSTYHPQGCVGCDMMYNWPWMSYHAFHISCGHR